jgi:hypothetical protein
LSKAHQFAEAAAVLYDEARGTTEHPDAYVTQAVHSGIASADTICIRRLGEYSATGAHDEAIALLGKADKGLAKHLVRLLGLKTKAGYSTSHVSNADIEAARRAHLSLLESADST